MAGRAARDELRRRVDELQWFHSIDVGHGVVTKGISEATLPDAMLPDFEGKTVLDIGAWDGYYSYLAERRGASRVVAIDHYAWGVDIPARDAYWKECAQARCLPDPRRDVTDFWRADLPGKRGFDLVHEILDSTVESVVADFTDVDLDELGTFDIVVYCGVLYHMKEPLTCLERVRAVTRERAVIETEAVHIQHREEMPLCEFRAGDEVNGDFGNWFVPDITSFRAMCRAAGFTATTVVNGAPPPEPPAANRLGTTARDIGRQIVRWLDDRREQPPPSARTQHYRAVLHAVV